VSVSHTLGRSIAPDSETYHAAESCCWGSTELFRVSAAGPMATHDIPTTSTPWNRSEPVKTSHCDRRSTS
jgi:hypothetical protein